MPQADRELYGVAIDGNAKRAQKSKTQFQNTFTQDRPQAGGEVYGVAIDGNAKRGQKSKTQFQKTFTKVRPQANEINI